MTVPVAGLTTERGGGSHPSGEAHRSESLGAPPRPTRSVALRALVLAELVTLVVFGVLTVARYPLFGPDEMAHYSYVQSIAEHQQLPILGQSPMSPEALAIEAGAYPRIPHFDEAKMGLVGLSYEAFQPPLYYLAAAPVFAAVPGYRAKAYALRSFDLFLFLLAVALAAWLARSVLRERWLVGFAGMLLVFDLPNVVLNSVSISNGALAIPIALGFLLALWKAWERHSRRLLLLASALLGLAVLTELELISLGAALVVVVAAEAWRDRRPASLVGLIGVLLLPLLLVSPWLAFNEVHFHALTAGALAVKEQRPIVNPHDVHFGVGGIPGQLVVNFLIPNTLLPEQWGTLLVGRTGLSFAGTLLTVSLFPLALLAAVATRHQLWDRRAALLALPLLAVLVVTAVIEVHEQTADIRSRYTFPVLAAWGLWVTLLVDGLFRERRATFLLGLSLWAIVVWYWVDAARVFLVAR